MNPWGEEGKGRGCEVSLPASLIFKEDSSKPSHKGFQRLKASFWTIPGNCLEVNAILTKLVIYFLSVGRCSITFCTNSLQRETYGNYSSSLALTISKASYSRAKTGTAAKVEGGSSIILPFTNFIVLSSRELSKRKPTSWKA